MTTPLLIDYREGSKDLIDPLRRMGLPAEETDLSSGDVAFVGRGEGGRGELVGIEFKKLPELMSSLRTNRLNEQAERMRDDGYRFRYLFIEGDLYVDDYGHMLKRVGRRDFKPIPGIGSAELFKRVFVLHLCMGLNPVWLPNRRLTLKAIEMLYRTFTDTDLDKHKSHLGIYEAATGLPMSEKRRALCALPGVQRKVSKAAEERFGTIRNAINASPEMWAGLQTVDDKGRLRRFGESNARRLVEFVTS